jgi:hypothetical protein
MIYGAEAYAAGAVGGLVSTEPLSVARAIIGLTLTLTVSAESSAGWVTNLGTSLFPPQLDEVKQFGAAVNNCSSRLAEALAGNASSLTLVDASRFPDSGFLTLDIAGAGTAMTAEIVYYDGKAGNVLTLVARGQDGTTAKAFAIGARAEMRHIARHHNLVAETIVALEQSAFDLDAAKLEAPVALSQIENISTEKLLGRSSASSGVIEQLTVGSGLVLSGGTLSTITSDAAYNAKAHGLAGDGVTDDTSALQALINLVCASGGGTIYFPPGVYLITGPLQDTSDRNAQLLLPFIPDGDEIINLSFVGALEPPQAFWTKATTKPTGRAYSIIKSTLTGATGTASLIAGTDGTNDFFNNLTVNLKNLIFEVPADPTFTVINLLSCLQGDISHVLIHPGTLDLDG